MCEYVSMCAVTVYPFHSLRSEDSFYFSLVWKHTVQWKVVSSCSVHKYYRKLIRFFCCEFHQIFAHFISLKQFILFLLLINYELQLKKQKHSNQIYTKSSNISVKIESDFILLVHKGIQIEFITVFSDSNFFILVNFRDVIAKSFLRLFIKTHFILAVVSISNKTDTYTYTSST